MLYEFKALSGDSLKFPEKLTRKLTIIQN